MTKMPRSAIILGGGPTGCFTALTLANAGYTTTIYELRSEPTTAVGGGVSLSPNAIRILNHIGLGDKAIAAGHKIDSIVMRNSHGQMLGTFEDGVEKKYGTPLVMIKRMRFLRILLDAVKEKGITIHYNKKANSITETDSNVTVAFNDGTSATADMLLGCDGIHSFVRTSHVAPTISEIYTGHAVAFQFIDKSTMNPLPIIPADMTGNTGPEGFVGLMRSAPDEMFWMAQSETPLRSREGWRESDPTAVQKALMGKFGHWASPIPEVMQADSSEMYWYPLHKLDITSDPTYRWHTNRTFLLGDAAHAMPPHAGQGTALGFEDAVILSRCLEKYAASLPVSEIFEKVYEIRAPRVLAVLERAMQRGGERGKVSPWVAYFREWAIWAFLWLKNPKSVVDEIISYNIYDVEV
ncbi:hypothetical protein HDV00_011003 [Rhizophlyctis rosea]|nr:hypothetical protein HDV00_011003 [Rhizophlyctis rosea]